MRETGASIVQMAQEACARHGDAGAFLCLGARLGFRELDSLSNAFAHWLVQQGLQPGERVAIQLPNLLQYPVVALGVLKAGLVIVNVNPLYTAPELEHQLRDAGAKVLVVSANTAHIAARVVPRTAVQCVVVTEQGDLHPVPQRLLLNFIGRRVRKQVQRYRFPVQVTLHTTLQLGRQGAQVTPDALVARAPGPDALAVLQYTGGTTGHAKGAMLSHRNLLANVQQLAAALGVHRPHSGAVMVAPLPLYHVYAFTSNFLCGLAWGQQVLLIPNPRDIGGFVQTLRRHRCNSFIGINTLYKALCDHPDFCRLDFSGLILSSSGGMALAPEVAARWLELTGCRILEGYGLSECSPLVACQRFDACRSGTVGLPAPDTELVLKAPDGQVVGPGAAGEVCVRGPQVMQGYWQQPQETAAAFDADGYLHSGDIGIFDPDGQLRIVERIKDMIIISGFNVYPNEIEEHVCTHPDILEAAVIGTGDDYATCIKVFVVTKNPVLGANDVLAWCREGLAPYKVPKQVEFRSTLPRSSVGKVLRRELRTPPAGEGVASA